MADIHGSPADAPQMPQAGSAGSAPVPYSGQDYLGQPHYDAPAFGDDGGATSAVMADAQGGILQESPQAHDIAAGVADAPYYPGPLSPIDAIGDDDAGGRDPVAASVAEAVSNADARWHEFEQYTHIQGSHSGDLMHFPPSPLDPGAGVGNTLPTGGFYDPDRDYGGPSGAPSYGGEQGLPGEQGKAL